MIEYKSMRDNRGGLKSPLLETARNQLTRNMIARDFKQEKTRKKNHGVWIGLLKLGMTETRVRIQTKENATMH